MTQESSKFPMPDEFQDPLENYDSKTYDDPIAEALAEKTVAMIQHEPYASISPDTTVEKAVHKLASSHIACLLVEHEEKLVGVFSDRDVLNGVALEYDQIKDQPVSEFMTDMPVYVYATDPAASALSVMAVSGYRHVPVLGSGDKLTGIVSPQRVTGFLQQFFEKE